MTCDAVIIEPICLEALVLGWPFRDVLDCGKGGRSSLGPGGALRGQLLGRELADSPNQATLSAAGETGGRRASGLN